MGARLSATMPNQKQNNPEIDIDQQIDKLVAGMTEATEQLEREIEQANQPDEDFETEAMISSAVQTEEAEDTDPTAESEAEAETEQASEPEPAAEETPEPESASEPEPEPEPVAEPVGEPVAEPVAEPSMLDAQIDEMLEDAAASVEQAPPSKSTVDAVDEELAELADEMLDGDFDDADTVLAAGIEQPAAAPKDPDEKAVAPAPPANAKPAEPEPEPADDAEVAADDLLDGDFDDADEVIAQGEPEPPKAAAASKPEPETEPKPEPEPSAEVVTPEPAPSTEPEPKASAPESAPEAKAEPKPKPEPEPEDVETVEPAPDRAARHKKRKGSIKRETEGMPRWRVIAEEARDRVGEAVYIVADKLTKPLDSRPEMLKGLTGWLAAVTLFNAAAVWVFLLIARGPAPGTSDEPSLDLVGQQTNAATQSEEID